MHSPTQVAHPELAWLERGRCARRAEPPGVGDRIERLLDELAAPRPIRAPTSAAEELRPAASPSSTAAGSARVVELASEARPTLLDALADDELVASLLSSTGCTPTTLDDAGRARRSSRCGRSSPRHGGDVELLDIDADAGAVRLRLLGSCDGCPSSAVTLQLAVERAIVEAAPEIVTHRRRRAATAPVSPAR